jgi:hypothetical protein
LAASIDAQTEDRPHGQTYCTLRSRLRSLKLYIQPQ